MACWTRDGLKNCCSYYFEPYILLYKKLSDLKTLLLSNQFWLHLTLLNTVASLLCVLPVYFFTGSLKSGREIIFCIILGLTAVAAHVILFWWPEARITIRKEYGLLVRCAGTVFVMIIAVLLNLSIEPTLLGIVSEFFIALSLLCLSFRILNSPSDFGLIDYLGLNVVERASTMYGLEWSFFIAAALGFAIMILSYLVKEKLPPPPPIHPEEPVIELREAQIAFTLARSKVLELRENVERLRKEQEDSPRHLPRSNSLPSMGDVSLLSPEAASLLRSQSRSDSSIPSLGDISLTSQEATSLRPS